MNRKLFLVLYASAGLALLGACTTTPTSMRSATSSAWMRTTSTASATSNS